MRPQGSPAELERRRLRAIELLERDIPVHGLLSLRPAERRLFRYQHNGFLVLLSGHVLNRTWNSDIIFVVFNTADAC